ncbi:MAG: hypothetical protein WDZ26_04520 [Nitriliruptoraceae bacterium]
MKRLFTLALGLGAGACVGAWFVRRLEEAREAMTPSSLAGRATRGVASVAGVVVRLVEQRLAQARAGAAEHERRMREEFDVPDISPR